MGLVTTQHAGFGDPNKPKPQQTADPKPVTGFDYAGQPMRPGAHYNGRPEHMAPEHRNETAAAAAAAATATLPERNNSFREGQQTLGVSATDRVRPFIKRMHRWSIQQRANQSAKMKAWHANRKAQENRE